MDICLLGAGKIVQLGTLAFTLAWTHSVQHTRWEEDWRLTPSGLVSQQARVEGSGAGMDPGANARFDGHWWRWQPDASPRPELVLRRAGVTEDWSLCFAGACRTIGTLLPNDADPVTLKACP